MKRRIRREDNTMFAAMQERMSGLLDKLGTVSADGVCVAGAAIADIIDNAPPPLHLEDG